MIKIVLFKRVLPILLLALVFGFGAKNVFAQTSSSPSYIPLIGISSVPEPLALSEGPGEITYHYAVKNFLSEIALTDVQVIDDKCSPVTFVEGDDNGDSKLDYTETWRYVCTVKLFETTQSIATAIGTANGLPAAHKAYATVVVGSKDPYPLVNIINISKVAYPLTLPSEGGDITFTYRVNNPGVIPLSDVRVTDDKCSAMSSKLGDTNGNNFLDITEVWIYTCTAHLNQTTTNTVSVEAFAGGLKAVGYASITVTVAMPSPNLPDAGKTRVSSTLKIGTWVVLLGIVTVLILFSVFTQKSKTKKTPKQTKKTTKSLSKLIFLLVFSVGVVGAGAYLFFPSQSNQENTQLNQDTLDNTFGWRFPVTKFPLVGTINQLAYSDIRDPGGIPQGLPVRLKIPVIGVDSAIEDAFISPDGRMDVPYGSVNVAWFALGPHPGQEGSAVIGGHFGIRNGVPFVFYKLDKLKEGDKVYIVDDKGDTLAFIVRSIKLFDRDADATTVFTSQDGLAHLNLITCEGVWNRVNDTYPERRVVFTDAIPFEGAVEVKAPSTVAVKPSVPVVAAVLPRVLRTGARGADVSVLQTALEQKDFLKMPRGVVKGFFGSLTRAAVTKYQTSLHLPATGVFDQLTRAKLMPQPIALKPTLPVTAVTTGMDLVTSEDLSQPASRLTFLQFMKSLYATPLDGLVTSCLLLAIAFIAFIIIRKR